MSKKLLIVFAALALMLTGQARAGTAEDEKAIRALQDVFAKGIMTNNPKLKSSIWARDGTLAPPTGGFFQGPEAIEKDFEQDLPSA